MEGQRGRRAGIREVASAAGVSITTASHALNGKGRVPERTRVRVREVATRLGYRANVNARSLSIGRSLTLAMQVSSGGDGETIVPDAAYFVELLNGASSEALTHGYSLVLAPPGASPENVHRLQVDGAIIVDPVGTETMLQESELPIVTTGRLPGERRNCSWVDNDHTLGTYAVLNHLRQAGYSNPGLLTSSGPQSYLGDIEQAYRSWCNEAAVTPVVVRVSGFPNEASGAKSTSRLLTRRRPPDSLYATLDRLAVGALLAAESIGLKVPKDLGLVSVSDSPTLKSVLPPITALDLHAEEIGRQAVRLLLELVNGDTDLTDFLIASELRVRASSQRFD